MFAAMEVLLHVTLSLQEHGCKAKVLTLVLLLKDLLFDVLAEAERGGGAVIPLGA